MDQEKLNLERKELIMHMEIDKQESEKEFIRMKEVLEKYKSELERQMANTRQEPFMNDKEMKINKKMLDKVNNIN